MSSVLTNNNLEHTYEYFHSSLNTTVEALSMLQDGTASTTPIKRVSQITTGGCRNFSNWLN